MRASIRILVAALAVAGDAIAQVTFAPALMITDESGAPQDVVAADFDGDGNLDFLTQNVTRTLSAYLGDGALGFTGPIPSSTPFGPRGTALADFDEDGRLDAVIGNSGANPSGYSYFFSGDGTGA